MDDKITLLIMFEKDAVDGRENKTIILYGVEPNENQAILRKTARNYIETVYFGLNPKFIGAGILLDK